MNLNPLRLLRRAAKDYKPGPAVVDRWEAESGHEKETFTPELYGNYLATSVGVYTCANLRARNLAQLPLLFWKLDGKGEKQPVTTGPLVDVMHRVNPFWTLGRLIRMTELSLCLWGEGFWFLERGPTGKQTPREIWWARPDRVKIVPDPVGYIKGYILESKGVKIPFSADEVIWFPYDNPIDEFAGLSPIAAARLSIDLNTASLRSNKKLFDQGMQIGGIVTPRDKDVTLTKEQAKELSDDFDRRFRGVDKAHRWMVLTGMVDVKSIGMSPKDAEFLGAMKWTLEDICRVYGVPLDLVGGQRTYENVNAAQESLWRHALIPEAAFLAEELTEKLLPMFPGQATLAEFDLSGVAILQEDRAAVVEQMKTLAQIGVPLNPLLQEFLPQLLPDGKGYEWGDVWWAPVNLLPAGTAPAPAQQAERALEGIREWLNLQSGNGHQKMLAAPAWEFGGAEHEGAWKRFIRAVDPHERTFEAAMQDLFRRQQESVLARLDDGTRSAEGTEEVTFDRANLADEEWWNKHGKQVTEEITLAYVPVASPHRQESVLARLTEERGAKSADDALEEPFDKAKWGKIFKASGKPLIEATFTDMAESTLLDLAVGFGFDVGEPGAVRFLEGSAQRFAREVNATTWDALKATLAEGIDAGEGIPKLSTRVKDVFTDASDNRAKVIARTEVLKASNGGALQAAKQSKVVKGKVWLTALDDRVDQNICVPLHNETAPLDGAFPGGFDAPPAHPQCRCSMRWVLKED